MLWGALCGALLVSALCVSASPIVLVDSLDGNYVKPGPKTQLDKKNVDALIAGVTGLMPSSPIEDLLSSKLSALLRPSPLRKPKAFLAVNVGGLSSDAVAQLWPNRKNRAIDLTGDGCSAMAAINGISRVSATNPNVKLTVVDTAGVQNCKGNCVEQHLSGAADICAAKVSAGQSPLTGRLEFSNGDSLDLSQSEDKMFAVELASIYAGLKTELAALAKRAELQVSQDDVELYEVSFMGLHALAKKYGKDSSVVESAANAVTMLLKWAVDGLDAAYSGDVVYQVLLTEAAPAHADTFTKLVNWKDATRRQLLQAPYPETDEIGQAKRFSAKAAGYGAFILLLYFSLAAIWCMCNMPFKQDTLLYGSKKDQ